MTAGQVQDAVELVKGTRNWCYCVYQADADDEYIFEMSAKNCKRVRVIPTNRYTSIRIVNLFENYQDLHEWAYTQGITQLSYQKFLKLSAK